MAGRAEALGGWARAGRDGEGDAQLWTTDEGEATAGVRRSPAWVVSSSSRLGLGRSRTPTRSSDDDGLAGACGLRIVVVRRCAGDGEKE